MRKSLLILILILFLASFFRLLWIDKIPHSVNGDEIHYLLSAKSFFLTGKDITQTTTLLDILLFRSPPGEVVQAELPYFLELISVGPFPFTMTGNALPNVILGMLTIFIIYLITRKLVNEQAALFSSFVAAVNPWFIFMGRTSYEMIPATFFYLLGFYILLITKSWRMLLAFPIFVLAFYSYIGTKLIFLPFILISVIYCYFFVQKRKYAKQYIILMLLAVLFVGFFIFQLKTGPTSRLSDLMLPNSSIFSEQVNAIRKTSIDFPLLSLFENKYTVYLDLVIAKILHTLSPLYLFIEGDYFASLGKHGLFYILDLIFFIIGGTWLLRNNKTLLILLSLFIVIALLPQVFYKAESLSYFTPHITMLVPFFIMIIGTGIWRTVTTLHKKNLHIITGILGLVYIFFIGNFANIYFFQLPIQPNFYNFSERIAAQYIKFAKSENRQIIIYTPNSVGKFKEYIFYSNVLTRDDAATIAQELQKKQQTIDGVNFLSCDKSKKKINTKDLILIHRECEMSFNASGLTIPQLSDGGAVYTIFNDSTCNKYQLPRYVSGLKISDFSVDKLGEQAFCTTFITH